MLAIFKKWAAWLFAWFSSFFCSIKGEPVMSALSVEVPFPVFYDRSGEPLENGYVWIGQANLNPQTNPIQVYFDSNLTQPAAQPLRTLAGYISNAGTPAQIYVDATNFSILVQDKNGTLVYSFLDATGQNLALNAQNVIYDPPFTNAVQTNVEAKLAEIISVKDFGAIGDGVTDNLAAFQAAVNSLALTGGVIHVPGGPNNNQYLFKTQSGPQNPSIQLDSNIHIVMDDDVYLLSEGGVASGVNGYNQSGSSQKALFVNNNTTNGNENISIVGGNIKSVATSPISGAFIALQNVQNVKISNIKMWDTNSACRMQLSYCKDAIIDSILVGYESNPSPPFSFEDGIRIGSGCNGVTISNCILNSGDDAIALNNEPAETQNVLTSTSGFPFALTGSSIQNVNITNCHITTRSGNAIRIYNEPTMTTGVLGRFNISNITAYPANSGAGNNCISVEDFNSRHAIQYVNFDNMYISCINNTGGAGINLVYADFVTISNSTFQTPAVYGILSGNSLATRVVSCNVFNTANVDGVAFFAGSSGSSCINSNVNGTARDGIHIEANECVIANNVLGNITRNGVRMENNAQNIIVRDNRIISTGAATFEAVGCNNNTVIGNNVLGGTTIDISAAGGNSVYEKNLGFNPVGTFAVGGTGSPQTLTADRTTTTFTIGGGTVTAITVGGQGTNLTSGAFCLPPNTSMVVSYTVGPTITKTIH